MDEEEDIDPVCGLCDHRLVPPARMMEHPRLENVPVCALCFELQEEELKESDESESK